MRTQDLIPSETLEIEQPYDPWMEVAVELEEVSQALDLEPWIVERLRHCESELNCNLLLRRDDGAMQTCRAIRVGYSSVFPNQCGELRITSKAYLNSTRAAAARNTWSAALFGLPLAGSATALISDPRDLSERELHRLVLEFAGSTAAPSVKEMLLPGDGANEYVFGWLARSHNPASLVLNPCHDSASAGLAFAIRRLSKARVGTRPMRIALQGFGAAERSLAQHLVAKGASLVAVVDHSGGVCDSLGLNLPALQAHVEREQLLFEYPDAEPICNADLLQTKCDVLVLATNERQVTGMNAEHVKASLVVECVPDAVSTRAEEVMGGSGTLVLPYTFAHGIKLSAVAQHQGPSRDALSPKREQAGSRLAVAHALELILKCAQSRKVSMRIAAQSLAVECVARRLRFQGCGL